MLARTCIPRPPLSDFIEMLWLFDGYEAPHAQERVLPHGGTQLIINLRDDRLHGYDNDRPEASPVLSGAIIAGPRSEFVVIQTADVVSTLGVSFRPGGTRPFFDVPAGELFGRDVDVETLWGPAAARELRERVLAASTPEARFAILEEMLLARATWSRVRHPAVGFATKIFDVVPHTRTIADVTAQIGLSQRRFIELFRDATGLTPKRFCRVRRFQDVLGRLGQGRRVNWADVAVACGYFDHAHLDHDFRAFSGLTPSDYLDQRTKFQNHVRVD